MNVPHAIQTALQAAVRDGVFPGAVLAVRISGELRFVAVAGRLSADEGSPPVHPSTIYDLASLTKPLVTATSVLLLVQHARLTLDDSAQSMLSELKGSPIGSATVRQLLSHCTGLPGWRPLYERLEEKGLVPDEIASDGVRQAVVRLIRDEPLIYERGTRSLYSDLGFILLGLIVERVGGLPLDRWFQARLAAPLGAFPLVYTPLDGPSAVAGHIRPVDRSSIAPTEWAGAKNRLLCGEVHDENALAMGGVAGHAGLFGTAEAVLAISGAWLGALRGVPSLLDRDLARAFTARQRQIPESSWALGWDTPTAPSSSGAYFSPESFGHLGYTGTSLWIDPQRNLEVVLLSNRVHPSRKNEKIRQFRPAIHDLIVQQCG